MPKHYAYDNNLSNLLTTTGADGTTTYGYDWLSRLTSTDNPPSTGSGQATQADDEWTYDAESQTILFPLELEIRGSCGAR